MAVGFAIGTAAETAEVNAADVSGLMSLALI